MARPLRIEYPGAFYHVATRGNAHRDVFYSDRDRVQFFQTCFSIKKRCNFLFHAYCLMNNHYHLLLETPDGNLSQGMRQLNGVYTQRFNHAHRSVGHLFQGRYKAHLIEKGPYLLAVARYIVLNPIRAGLVNHPEDYQWSSYRATAGLVRTPKFLTTSWILGQFGETKDQARQQYQDFVNEGINGSSPFQDVQKGCVLGSQRFVDAVREDCGELEVIEEVPRVERMIGRPSLDVVFEGISNRRERNQAIRFAVEKCAYSAAEVARYLGMHYSLISKVLGDKNSRFKT